MAVGDSAIFTGTASQSQTTAVDWETEYAASPGVPKKAKFDINEGDTPQTVAQNLADVFNSRNNPSFNATAHGPNVRFTAESSSYVVNDMKFTADGQTTNIPGEDGNVAVGNTGVSVRNANG